MVIQHHEIEYNWVSLDYSVTVGLSFFQKKTLDFDDNAPVQDSEVVDYITFVLYVRDSGVLAGQVLDLFTVFENC